jgi:hypothetical protein
MSAKVQQRHSLDAVVRRVRCGCGWRGRRMPFRECGNGLHEDYGCQCKWGACPRCSGALYPIAPNAEVSDVRGAHSLH